MKILKVDAFFYLAVFPDIVIGDSVEDTEVRLRAPKTERQFGDAEGV